jgi:hypothetical protein
VDSSTFKEGLQISRRADKEEGQEGVLVKAEHLTEIGKSVMVLVVPCSQEPLLGIRSPHSLFLSVFFRSTMEVVFDCSEHNRSHQTLLWSGKEIRTETAAEVAKDLVRDPVHSSDQ